jgi:hypothetical protein
VAVEAGQVEQGHLMGLMEEEQVDFFMDQHILFLLVLITLLQLAQVVVEQQQQVVVEQQDQTLFLVI